MKRTKHVKAWGRRVCVCVCVGLVGCVCMRMRVGRVVLGRVLVRTNAGLGFGAVNLNP